MRHACIGMVEIPEPLPCLERDLNNMHTRERGWRYPSWAGSRY